MGEMLLLYSVDRAQFLELLSLLRWIKEGCASNCRNHQILPRVLRRNELEYIRAIAMHLQQHSANSISKNLGLTLEKNPMPQNFPQFIRWMDLRTQFLVATGGSHN